MLSEDLPPANDLLSELVIRLLSKRDFLLGEGKVEEVGGEGNVEDEASVIGVAMNFLLKNSNCLATFHLQE